MNTLLSVASSTNVLISAAVWSAVALASIPESFDARASVNALVSLSASYNDLISAPVWSAVAAASIPSSLEWSALVKF